MAEEMVTTLHSTMFLLKPWATDPQGANHYTLHSTMFLLKPAADAEHAVVNDTFTFHNVSIKTPTVASINNNLPTLHSTMFLLKLGRTD